MVKIEGGEIYEGQEDKSEGWATHGSFPVRRPCSRCDIEGGRIHEGQEDKSEGRTAHRHHPISGLIVELRLIFLEVSLSVCA